MTSSPEFITFILGAGSSYEVNMPVGNDLKARIASAFDFIRYKSTPASDNDRIRDAIYALGQCPGNENSHTDFLAAAARIAAAMPQAPSIDNFIDSHRSNPIISRVGKLAIASEILKAERQSTLYFKPNGSYKSFDFQSVANTWFNAFFQLLCLNTQEEDLPGRLSRVRVVTFNYDRTLEHFLYHSIQNYYNSTPERAAEIVSNLSIIHAYGQVGTLPWQAAENSVPYGNDISYPALIKVAESLRTFTEGTSEASQIDQIRSAIFDAETLVFLGFAFHELNLELLFGSQKEIPTRYTKQIFGTAKGISESDKKKIIGELASLGRLSNENITLRRELTAAELLPEYSRSLRVPSSV